VDKKKSVNAFFAGFQSVFGLGGFINQSCNGVSQREYLMGLIKGREDDALNLRNDWKKILSVDLNQSKVIGECDGGAKRTSNKNRKSAK